MAEQQQYWLDSIVSGGLPHSHGIPRKATFEYSNGFQFTFEGAVLNDLWMEFIMLRSILAQMRQGPPPVKSDQFRNMMEQKLKPTPTED